MHLEVGQHEPGQHAEGADELQQVPDEEVRRVHHCMLAVTASAWQNLGRQDTIKFRASYTMFVRSPALHGQ
jgi:hypothetical protein